MCDRTRKCPDYKLLPIQLEIVRAVSNILPLSGAERNYREACIDLMLEGNERIHSKPTEEVAKEVLDMIDHLHQGITSIDSTGVSRIPFGDPRLEEIERIKAKHLAAVRDLDPKYAKQVEDLEAPELDHEKARHKALTSLDRAIEKSKLLPMTASERADYDKRCERLREIGSKIGSSDVKPIEGLALVIESIRLVKDQTNIEQTVAARVGQDHPNYAKVRETYLSKKRDT